MQIILFSALAGICGTGLGGIISLAIGTRSPSSTCWMLSFAGGVMTSIVCFGLVPESVELSGIFISIVGLILGVVVILILNRIVDGMTETSEEKMKVHSTPEELHHTGGILTDRNSLMRSGIIMLTAIGLHNIPEGMAIGAGGSHSMQLGLLLALMIALHNIPEGMSIASPLIAGGMNKWKAVILTALSGAPTLLGGVIGVLLGNISDTAIALSLSAAGGAMLYVVFGEIIPQSVVMTKDRVPTLITLFGIIIGLLVSSI